MLTAGIFSTQFKYSADQKEIRGVFIPLALRDNHNMIVADRMKCLQDKSGSHIAISFQVLDQQILLSLAVKTQGSRDRNNFLMLKVNLSEESKDLYCSRRRKKSCFSYFIEILIDYVLTAWFSNI